MNTRIILRCEALISLVYLTQAQARNPDRVLEYMKEAHTHIREMMRIELQRDDSARDLAPPSAVVDRLPPAPNS